MKYKYWVTGRKKLEGRESEYFNILVGNIVSDEILEKRGHGGESGKRVDISFWDKRYEPKDCCILDGESWTVKYKREGEKVIKKTVKMPGLESGKAYLYY